MNEVKKTMVPETKKQYLLTAADAVLHIKRAPSGTRFCLHVNIDMPVLTEPGRVFRNGFSSYLNLSRKDAMNMLSAQGNGVPVLEERGARIPITDIHSKRTKWDAKRSCMVEYDDLIMWIGG